MMLTPRTFSLALLAPVVALVALTAAGPSTALAQSAPAARGGSAAASAEVDRRWLERLDDVDRAALDQNIGYAPPDFTSDLVWVGMTAPTWKDLRGKVIVLQTWTSRSGAGRNQPQRVSATLRQIKPEDLVIIGVHTPEGADNARSFLERAPAGIPVAIDPTGAFCDALGAYKRPVNIVVDRNGTVRFAGLNANGLEKAVEQLVAEKANPEATPRTRDAEPAQASGTATFPAPTGTISAARDQRGKAAPAFVVDRWLTRSDNPNGRLLVLDFWATWCGPCMAAVPHMNEIANAYRNDVCIIGITDETASQVEQGLLRRNAKESDFHYALASDPDARLMRFFGVRGIPHCAIISADNVVRWQGNPAQLTPAVMNQLVAANRALRGTPGASSGGGRWAREKR